MYHGNVLEMVIKYELNYVVSQTNLLIAQVLLSCK